MIEVDLSRLLISACIFPIASAYSFACIFHSFSSCSSLLADASSLSSSFAFPHNLMISYRVLSILLLVSSNSFPSTLIDLSPVRAKFCNSLLACASSVFLIFILAWTDISPARSHDFIASLSSLPSSRSSCCTLDLSIDSCIASSFSILLRNPPMSSWNFSICDLARAQSTSIFISNVSTTDIF